MSRALAALALVCLFAGAAEARRWQTHPAYDLIVGRWPVHVPEFTDPRVDVPPIGDDERLAWQIQHGGRDNPQLYVQLADRLGRAGEIELQWWALMRAAELGATDQLARCHEIEAAWRAAGRPDAPTAEQYRYVRAGAERWVVSFQKAERQALADHENPSDPAVLARLTGEADIEVPQVVFGADSFMRRWGLGLLIAGIAAFFWGLYLIAILRKRAAPR